MSDLSNPLATILEQASKLPENGALKPYTERLNAHTSDVSIICLDTSGSMAETIESGERKIDVLRTAVDACRAGNEIIVAFASKAIVIANNSKIPEPSGGTDMAAAIKLALPYKPKTTLFISDGIPDSRKQTLNLALQLSGIINTLFIGRDSDAEAKAFMRELARIGCGKSRVCDIYNPQRIPTLSYTIKSLLLGSPTNQWV